MKTKCALLLILIVGSGTKAKAATISVSSTITPGYTLTESAADARYKFDTSTWDIGLFVPATQAAANSNTASLGNDIGSFNGVAQNFKLTFTGGSLNYTLGTKSVSRTALSSMNALDIAETLSPPSTGGYIGDIDWKSGIHGCKWRNIFLVKQRGFSGTERSGSRVHLL
jgi:hypothetical protein